jgi:riboflavin biosynthesis pyrimidine reductase
MLARALACSRYRSAPDCEAQPPHFDYLLPASVLDVLVRTAKAKRPLCVHFLARILRRSKLQYLAIWPAGLAGRDAQAGPASGRVAPETGRRQACSPPAVEAAPEKPRTGKRSELAMKPHVACIVSASIDGRIWLSRWSPDPSALGGLFERVHDEIGGDAWLVGRTTGKEFSRRESYPDHTSEIFPREHWFAQREAKACGVVLDAHGRIAFGRSEIGGDPIVAVLTKRVSDAHLAGLRSEGISYVFAGETEIDLGLLLEILSRELGVKRLLVEGGGTTNGSFLRAGLIDEIHLILNPAVDGTKGAPSAFDSPEAGPQKAPLQKMTLESSQPLEGGALWLRYRVQNR